jgi:hypothetical protein
MPQNMPAETRTAEAPENKPQTGHGPRAQAQLPIVEKVHTLDEAGRVCRECGDIDDLKTLDGKPL